MKLTNKLLIVGIVLTPAALLAADINVTANITADTTWTKDNSYILKKSIFVKNGAKLTIEPGTSIYGTNSEYPSFAPSGSETYGSLIITRGSQIFAEGTAAEPIVFTALEEREGIAADGSTLPLDPSEGDGGFWGGLIVLGSAPINYYVGGVNANENEIEGFPSGSTTDIQYGGSVPADNSGVIKYVSLRFGGYEFSSGKEINGLTLGGVGSGTTIDYVEVFSNTDDGVEFFGGTVNTKHIAVAFCQDDCFDMDEGQQGFHQFWFAIQNTDDSLGDNLGEWDGGNGNIKSGAPFNLAQVYNATLIGSGGSGSNDGIAMENNFAGTLANSVITDVPDDAIKDKSDGVGSPKPFFFNNTFGMVGDPALLADVGSGLPLNPDGSGNSNVGVDLKLGGISRTNNGGLDPRPLGDSPLFGSQTAPLPANAPAGFFSKVAYRGAFASNSNWLDGWSYLSTNGYLPAVSDVDVIDDITTDTTWTKDNNYILKKSIFVKNGAKLTIEPGTTIYGTNSEYPSFAPSGSETYGSLIITRGSQIFAEGTAAEPIVFTALEEREGIAADGSTLPLDPSEGDGGFWGGLIVLGSAPINYYVGGVNANENEIEGFPSGSTTDIQYGGSVPADNSGVIKYVSLRFGGYEFSSGKEINGLTLGGVGSGTTIDYVEVFSNTDDGVEFFGGTVNTSHIAVAFCQDDSYDMDEGQQGYHQFWFAIQNTDDALGDNLGEWDGGNGNIKSGTPFNLAQVYNATLIGSGGSGSNDGIAMENNFAGTLANSVITDVPDDAIKDKSDGVGSPKPFFFNNTFGVVGDPALLDVVGSSAVTAPGGANNGSGGVDVKLAGISRSADGGLDPRPELGSPLRGAPLAPIPNGAPSTFQNVSYRGAFGDSNWLNGWSYLYQAGYMTGLPDGGSSSDGSTGGSTGGSLVDTDGDGISDDVENANTALGFNAGVNNGSIATVFDGLFTSSSIQDLSADDIVVSKVGNDVTLTIPVESSADLVAPFTPVGNATLNLMGVSSDKQFFRFRVTPEAP